MLEISWNCKFKPCSSQKTEPQYKTKVICFTAHVYTAIMDIPSTDVICDLSCSLQGSLQEPPKLMEDEHPGQQCRCSSALTWAAFSAPKPMQHTALLLWATATHRQKPSQELRELHQHLMDIVQGQCTDKGKSVYKWKGWKRGGD